MILIDADDRTRTSTEQNPKVFSPTRDFVEVVRCKYCKHSRKDDIFHTRWCQKPGHCKVVKDEFYCAWGERKDDGN